jgi:DNA-binding transcriptional ArsR family regulator
MAAVSETMAREYLESLGFLVRQPTKYQVTARAKRADEEPDLIAVNPQATGASPRPGLWTSAELRRVRRAVVSVRGWHTERITPAVLDLSPEIFRLADPGVMRAAEQWLGPGPIARVLCLPALPSAAPTREEVLRRLREGGVEGVVPFRTMLCELTARVDANANYEKSDLLQVMRILKKYGLLHDAQLDLFPRRIRRGRARAAAPPSGARENGNAP